MLALTRLLSVSRPRHSEDLSEDPSLATCFFPGRVGMGDGDSRVCVVVDRPLDLSKIAICSLKFRKSTISHFQNGLFGEKQPPEGTLPTSTEVGSGTKGQIYNNYQTHVSFHQRPQPTIIIGF